MAKKCIICLDPFVPKFSTLEKCCQEIDCKVKYSMQVVEKQKVDKEKKRKQDWAKEKVVLREKIIGIPELKKDLEKEINKICCLLDYEAGCISCEGQTTPQAGHYHTVQSNGAIRFNLDNLHMQDFNCNCKKGGNIHQYDLGLIKRYGKEYWEYVKFDIVSKYPLLKMAVFEYKEKIAIARGVVKWLKLQNKVYSAKERIELRKVFNEQIGIYK